MMSLIEIHIFYALAWCSFGFGHSLLASERAKQFIVPSFGPYYRLAYNALASVHIFAVWLLGFWLFDGTPTFALSTTMQGGLFVTSLLGIAILVLALREYDLGLLAGTAQIRNHRSGLGEPKTEALHTNGFHAYVRHPLYSGVYLFFWGNCQDQFSLATAIWGSIYLTVGAMHEERYLLRLYGDAYQNYRAKVPAFFPWRGRVHKRTGV